MAHRPLVIMLNLYVTSPTNLEKEHMLVIPYVYVGRSISYAYILTGNKSDVFSYVFFFQSQIYKRGDVRTGSSELRTQK